MSPFLSNFFLLVHCSLKLADETLSELTKFCEAILNTILEPARYCSPKLADETLSELTKICEAILNTILEPARYCSPKLADETLSELIKICEAILNTILEPARYEKFTLSNFIVRRSKLFCKICEPSIDLYNY